MYRAAYPTRLVVYGGLAPGRLEPRRAGRDVSSNTEPPRIWIIVSVILLPGTLLSAILGAVTLDYLIQRPSGGGSVTTLIPGFVYANATVMKVCLIAGVASVVIALMKYATTGRRSGDPVANRSKHGVPAWGITSIAVPASTPLIGALGVVIAQALADKPAGLSVRDFTDISRSAVFVTLAFISVGAVSALTSLVKRERPSLVPVLGFVANVLLIGLFWHLEFYARGFDQDMWAPR